MTTRLRWFGVRLLMESVHGEGSAAPGLLEDLILLVRASTLDEASLKAEAVARKSEERYESAGGDEITWRFKEVLDAKEVLDEDIGDGTQIYYSHLKAGELDMLRATLRPLDG